MFTRRILLAGLAACVTAAAPAAAHAAAGQLQAVASFGANPGALKMFKYVPPGLPTGRPLVLFMHGCSQSAADAAKVGWSELADQYQFAVVYPEQDGANNPIKCFNWAGEYGDPANLERGKGENQSIKEMVDKMKADHGVDPARVFVAGFSAGGAFVPVMLSTWPDLFAAGATMAGIPYRCATTVNGAYNCQALASHPELKKSPAQWGDLVRAAAGAAGSKWPRLVIFHGSSDGIVSPDNQVELVEQWTNVHGADQTADESTTVGSHVRERFKQGGAIVVESWKIAGMGHAVAMGADPEHACTPMGGTYIESKNLCAAYRAAVFFGLTGDDTDPGGQPDAGPGQPGQPDAGPTVPGAPTVRITAPGDGAEVSGSVTITAEASAGDGVKRVEFYVDDVLKGSDGTAPYTQLWPTAAYAPGAHTLRAVVYDQYEVSAEDGVSVTVGSGGGGAAGGDELVDPIPCGCASGHGAGGAGGSALLVGAALWLSRRPRRRPRP